MNTVTKTVLAAAAALTFAGCANNTAANTSETDPIVGQWQLSTVEKVVEGEEQQFLNREENASFFENEDNYYEFKSDGRQGHMEKDRTQLQLHKRFRHERGHCV